MSCINIGHTYKEILYEDETHYLKRNDKFNKYICFFDKDYGGVLKVKHTGKMFITSFFHLYDQILNFGPRYAFYEKKDELPNTLFPFLKGAFKEIFIDVIRPMTFFTVDYLVYKNRRKDFYTDIKNGLFRLIKRPLLFSKVLRERIKLRKICERGLSDKQSYEFYKKHFPGKFKTFSMFMEFKTNNSSEFNE